jgi:uncharacterized protein YbaP (TraB family)
VASNRDSLKSILAKIRFSEANLKIKDQQMKELKSQINFYNYSLDSLKKQNKVISELKTKANQRDYYDHLDWAGQEQSLKTQIGYWKELSKLYKDSLEICKRGNNDLLPINRTVKSRKSGDYS